MSIPISVVSSASVPGIVVGSKAIREKQVLCRMIKFGLINKCDVLLHLELITTNRDYFLHHSLKMRINFIFLVPVVTVFLHLMFLLHLLLVLSGA